jgi:hypothetical protein
MKKKITRLLRIKIYFEARKNINEMAATVSLPTLFNLCKYARSRDSEAAFQSNNV